MTASRHPRLRTLLNVSRVVAIVGVVALALQTQFGLGGAALDSFFSDWVYNGLIVIAASWCLSRAALVRADRLAWAALGLGLACWATAELINTFYLSKMEFPPYPSIADGFFIAFYPLSYVAIILLVRSRVARFHSSMWLDGLVAGLAVAAVGEILVFQPTLESTQGRAIEVAADLAYPAGDLLMLSLVFGVFALTGWRPGRAWAFIGAGLIAAAAADGIYLYQASNGIYIEGTILDVCWPAATLLVGYAAWARQGDRGRIRLQGWRAMALPTVFALVGLGILVYDHFRTIDSIAMFFATATLVTVIARMALTFGENLDMLRSSQAEAHTDALTGLANRRSLMNDLSEVLEGARRSDPRALIMFDLDGFKHFNDSFGHPAGDALLARLGHELETAVRLHGRAYRLGGDEFCALVAADATTAPSVVDAACDALTEEGDGFTVTASHGTVLLPTEAADATSAIQLADRRLYAHKGERKAEVIGTQTRDVLLQVIHEREPGLEEHHHDVAALALATGRELRMSEHELELMARAAELHDVGKVAVPETILDKPGPLDQAEMGLIRQHTLVGERMLAAAPALVPVARIVRASHENWDGSGYPDGLAGIQIPLASRVIAVADAYHAMTSDRPYQASVAHGDAIAELRRCAGGHFDPAVVDAFCRQMARAEDFGPIPRSFSEPDTAAADTP